MDPGERWYGSRKAHADPQGLLSVTSYVLVPLVLVMLLLSKPVSLVHGMSLRDIAESFVCCTVCGLTALLPVTAD